MVSTPAAPAAFDLHRAKLVGPTVAEQIVADVIDLGWPVGRVLGSEADLLERYGISRAVLREAVRLVEHQHVARMRRGPGGGLVVDEPDIHAVINAVILYLLRVDATLGDVIDTRLVLEVLVAEQAAERATEDDIPMIRQTLDDEAAGEWTYDRLLHSALASMTANPVLTLFTDILTRIGEFFDLGAEARSEALRREAENAHQQIAEAVLTNDPGLARARMRRHLEAEYRIVDERGTAIRRLPAAPALDGTAGGKRAEAVARAILSQILAADMQAGDFVGSEGALMAEHAASRAVLREAVRILDYHQIASMRRGPGGGLYVMAPDPTAVTDIVAIYLRRHGITAEHIVELLTGLDLAVVERAADRIAGPDGDRYAQPLRDFQAGNRPRNGLDPGLSWHILVASLTGNTALELVHRVVMRLGWLFFARRAQTDDQVRGLAEPANVEPIHSGITEALLAGDRELALMRMRAHWHH